MAADRASKKTEIYRELGQGLKTFHEHQHAEVDIVAVPGLGANPEECWTWENSRRAAAEGARRFNWIRDADGLASLFPKSRIMLYDYASAWMGVRKVRATMKSIASCLLDDLGEKRKDDRDAARPLIFIGHSMGGVVIAKTICMAKARAEFETIVTCTVGICAFGSPFRGSDMAQLALLVSSLGSDGYESLLSFMRTENNDALEDVTNDFVEICGKTTPPIDLWCAWEQSPTDLSDFAPGVMSKMMKNGFFKASAKHIFEMGMPAVYSNPFGNNSVMVNRESAVLQGAHEVGLTSDHRDLVKFESVYAEKFVPVKAALSKMVQSAKSTARKRMFFSGQNVLSHKFVNQVRRSLEGIDMRQKFRAKTEGQTVGSWLETEPVYQEWMTNVFQPISARPQLWITGGPGLGKTNAALTAIDFISRAHYAEQDLGKAGGHSEDFLAYFSCEPTPGCCTAEDLLKSLVTQMMEQDEPLAQHAKWFVPNPRHRAPISNAASEADTSASGTKATATVDNLWKCLTDMIEDPIVGTVHFVISNLHFLELGESTQALLMKLDEHAFACSKLPPSSGKVKWLLTSRHDIQISGLLKADYVSVVDLANDLAYGTKLRLARQEHARNAISRLRTTQKYRADLAYYVSNSIQSQSEDGVWIDLICILLSALPSDSSNLAIRKWFAAVRSFDTDRLIDHAWNTILSGNSEVRLEIEKMMNALTIAYEAPSLPELAILTSLDDVDKLQRLIRICEPIIRVETSGEQRGSVTFSHSRFLERLRDTALGGQVRIGAQKRQYHGVVALRWFQHMQTTNFSSTTEDNTSDAPAGLKRSSTVARRSNEDATVFIVATDEDDAGKGEEIPHPRSNSICSYPNKYLFRHLNEAFPDASEEVRDQDPAFWSLDSALDYRWLKKFQDLIPDFRGLADIGLSVRGMSALHVVAITGGAELVSVLLERKGKTTVARTSNDGMTPLHVAALNNHVDVLEKLIRAGADVEAGDAGPGTALHFAALGGHCNSMTTLIEVGGASINAFSEEYGPVINAAILSGKVNAVRQVMRGEVRFDLDYTKCECESPLSLSAGRAEPSVFQEILVSEQEKWRQNAKLLDSALYSASYSGKLESVKILLGFDHIYTNTTLENATLAAAREKEWSCVDALLDYVIDGSAKGQRRNIGLDNVFYLAASGREDHLATLQKIWGYTGDKISQDICDVSMYHASIHKKNATVVWLLETCRADANARSEQSSRVTAAFDNEEGYAEFSNALNAAASTGNASLVKSLIKNGAAINDGYALQLAASEGHLDLVEALLEAGASPSRKVENSTELGFYSAIALQAACDKNRATVVQALLKHGADPNSGGETMSHPILAATQLSSADILNMLLEAAEIDVNVVGGDDQSTALINAASHMDTDCERSLLDKRARIDERNSSGETALIVASRKGNIDCVTLLCERGADVTYRSPRHGMPIAVAAEALHPACARILAEHMGKTIAEFRVLAAQDPSKERLEQAIAVLKQRDQDVEGLEAVLAETRADLKSKVQDIEVRELEEARLLGMSSLRGETYESVGQQIKMVQNERAELLKQVDSLRGQVKLGDDTIIKVRSLLDEERASNTALRKHQGYKTLQEEKKIAEEASGLEKQRADELQQQLLTTQAESEALQASLREARDDLEAAEAASKTANNQAAMELRQKTELQANMAILKDEVTALRMQSEELGTMLSSVREEAAARATLEASEASQPSASLNASNGPDDFRRRPALPKRPGDRSELNGQATNGAADNTRASIVQSPVASPEPDQTRLPVTSPGPEQMRSPVASLGPEQMRFPVASPGPEQMRSPVASPGLGQISSPVASPSQADIEARATQDHLTRPESNSRTQTWQSGGGFRTIHGQHRADGSLGGYRNQKGTRRVPSDDLYSSSIKNESVGGHSMSTESVHSNKSTFEPDKSPGGWETNGNGIGNGTFPSPKTEQSRRVMWG